MLTSLSSTIEALNTFVANVTNSEFPSAIQFTSDLFSDDLKNLITNNTTGPETIASFIVDELPEQGSLEYNEIVDLKTAFFFIAPLVQIAELDNDDGYPQLRQLYKKAFQA